MELSKSSLVFIFLLILKLCASITTDEYFNERKHHLEEEVLHQLGFDLILTPEEQKVDKYLLALKQKELLDAKTTGRSLQEDIFMKVKDKIDEQQVFHFIRKMPKGAVNHIHDMSLGSYTPVIKKWTYIPECYMCHDEKEKILSFKISVKIPESISGCTWISVPEARKNSSDPEEFDNFLLSFFILNSRDVELKTQNGIWDKFSKVFLSFMGLFTYEEILKDYVEHSLDELIADNIQFVEIRSTLPPLYSLNDCLPNTPSYVLKTLVKMLDRYHHQHQNDYFGTKFIYTPLRHLSKDVISKAIMDSLAMRNQFPDYFAGFDLVGQEDLGLPLKHFIEPLLRPSAMNRTLPYIFHAGETDFYGDDIDENLFDAILLNTTRLGHGFALMKHPTLKEEARRKNIAVELCPISNQVLGLVGDIRDHPGSMLIAEGFPVTINPDDPYIWGASGISYDYYQAFMGMTSQKASLSVLKKLVLNSIEYSSLDRQERESLRTMWNSKWNEFIHNIIVENQL